VSEPVVALLVDGAPSYSWLARRCLQSLRRAGTQLDVVVFASQDAALDVRDIPNVRVTTVADMHENVNIEKWHRLSSVEAERVVFLDADTVCLQPLELLLDRYRTEDLYARQEAGTQRPWDKVADARFPAQVDWQAFARSCNLAPPTLPVVNCGVMIFNHWATRRLTDCIDALCELYHRWDSGADAYPCSNRHIMDEVALAAALHRRGSPSLGLISPEHVPFYAELTSDFPAPAFVLHVWSGLYRAFLRDTGTSAELSEYDFLLRRDALRRIQRRHWQRRTSVGLGG
jgi:hypothetical protein